MVFFGLQRIVVFFALLCVSVFVFPQPVNAAGEMYRWLRYDMISGGGGDYQALGPTAGHPVADFTQDPQNPLIYKASGLQDCSGSIVITVSSIPSQARVTTEGDCNLLKNPTTSLVIQGLGTAIESVEREARTLDTLHVNENCGGGAEVDGVACRNAASVRQNQEKERCRAAHNYQEHVTRGNAYLDCLAQALGVERPTSEPEEEEKEETPADSCQLPEPGWIACQLIEFTATLTDNTFELLRPFLEIEPLTKDIGARPGQTSAYVAWQRIRDVANVALVIALFVIIYSYLTGMGLGMYEIKKSLPRLIVTALLINTSFFIAGAMIDVSNIFGRSLQSMTTEFRSAVVSESDTYDSWLTTSTRILSITPTDEEFTRESTAGMTQSELEALGVPPPDTPPNQPRPTQSGNTSGEDKPPIPTIMIVNGAPLVGAAVLYANLAVLVPLMVMALFAMFVTLLILLFRQALVIILVVVAPLAIAAYILPGTKQYFDKWKSAFTQLLLLYPIIALIFAASVIASGVIRESAMNNGQSLLAIFSMAIMVIPLFVTPLILKFGGGILAQFGGTIQGIISKPRGAAMSAAQDYRKARKSLQHARNARGIGIGRFRAGGKLSGALAGVLPSNVAAAWRMGRDRKAHRIGRAMNEYQAQAIKDKYLKGIKDDTLRSDLINHLLTNVGDPELKNIEADSVSLQATKSNDELRQMSLEGKDSNGNALSEAERRAAQMAYMNTATLDQVHELMEQSQNTTTKQRADLVNLIRKKGLTAQAPHFSEGALNNYIAGGEGSNDVNKMIADAANGNRFAGGFKLSGASEDTLARLHTQMADGQVGKQQAQTIVDQAQRELASGVDVSRNANSQLSKISQMRVG